MLQRSMGTNMRSIVISFPLFRKDGSHVTRWISNAVMKGVKTIILNLDGGSGIVSFPFSILVAPGQACKVQYLLLNSCSLTSLSNRNSTLDSLVNIHLESVNLTDKQMDVILSKCLFLESLVLRNCPNLASFKLTSRNSRLRFLDIKCCLRLKKIELYAESLEIFEFYGTLDHFLFIHVPKLARLFACLYGDKVEFLSYALSRIATDAPLLQTLNVQLVQVLPLPKGVFTFTNVKHLVLIIGPCDGEDELDWISYVFEAFPFLNRLHLDLSKLLPRNTGWTHQLSHRGLAEVSHENLREVEVTGYCGGPSQVELVKYLVDRAFKIDVLVISSPAKWYVGLRDPIHLNLDHDNKPSSEKIEELHSVLPESLRVDYHNL